MSDFNGGVKLPAIPPKASDQSVTAIREILNIRFGGSADALDRSPTYRELLNAGAIKYTGIDGSIGVGSGGISMPGGGTISAPIIYSYAPPPAPTGLTAVGALATVLLSWTEPTYSNHSYTEVWRAAVVVILGITQPANFGDAVKIGAVPGFTSKYSDPVGNLGDYWYWIRFASTTDPSVYGAFSDIAGVRGTTSQNPAYVLGVLAGQITNSELSTSLNTTIGLITAGSGVAGSVANQVAAEAAARAAADTAEANSRATAITQEATNRAAAITAEANARGTAITNEATLRQSGDTALSQSISLLTAGVAGGFDPTVIYHFDATAEGWTSSNATQAWNAGWVDHTSTGTDPMFISPSGLVIAGVSNTVIKARIKRLAGSGWDGSAFYTTSGHGFSASHYKSIAVPSPFNIGDTAVVEWDMSTLTAGGSDWISNTITQIRLDLGASATDIISIDWIAVGRNAPGASTAALQTEQLARIAADQAEATARTTLAATVTANAATLATEQTTRATADTANANATTAVSARLNTGGDIATALTTNATGLSGLTTRVTAAEGAITSQSTSLTALNSSLANVVSNTGISLLPNWELNVADSAGKPAGIQFVEGAIGDVRTYVSFLDSTNQQMAITGAATAAYGFPAIPVDPNLTYTIEIRHKSSAASASGLYLRMNEKNAALSAGKTHVGGGGTTTGDARTSLVDMLANGAYPGTSWVTSTYTYKPTAGAQFASFSMYKWAAVDYHVELVKIYPKQNDNLIANSNAITTLQTTVTGQGTNITSISGSLTALTATVNSNNTSTNAAITAEQTARATADTANASSITNLTSTVSSNQTAALNAASAAQSTANTALTSATTANTAIANIASDSILSPVEKPSVIQARTVLVNEQAGIDAQATEFSPIIHGGTAQAATGLSLTLANTASSVSDAYKFNGAKITSGAGAGQSRNVVSSRKNLVLGSDDFSNPTYWSFKASTLTASQPDSVGGLSAVKIAMNAASSGIGHNMSTIAAPIGSILRFYIDIKCDTGTQFACIQLKDGSGGLENASIHVALTTAWQRVFIDSAPLAYPNLFVLFLPSNGTAISSLQQTIVLARSDAIDIANGEPLAYEHIKTLANAAVGIAVDTPWSSNQIPLSDITGWSNAGATIVGNTVTDSSSVAWQYLLKPTSSFTFDYTKTYAFSLQVAKDSVTSATRYCLFRAVMYGVTTEVFNAWFDTSTGQLINSDGNGIQPEASVLDEGDFWRVCLVVKSPTANTTCELYFFPAVGSGTAQSPTTTGSVIIGGLQVELDQVTPYIATGATPVLPPDSTSVYELRGTQEKFAYDTSIETLNSHLATLTTPVLWSNTAGDTTIVGATFRDKFSAVYSARQTLLNAISLKAKALADTATSNAATAQTTADTAVTASSANAASISTLSAQVNNVTTGLPATYAAVGSEATARANADNALSSSISSVSTTVNGHTSTIATQQTSINGIEAEYTVKLDVNGRMAGFGLSGNGTTGSAFIASVDTFAVESPNSSVPMRVNNTVYAVGSIAKINDTNGKMLVCKTGGTSHASVVPTMTEAIGTIITDGTVKWQIASRVSFSVLTSPQTINNVALPAGTYMDGAFIQNATINNAQIGNAAVDSLKLADTAVNTNHIVDGAISTAYAANNSSGYYSFPLVTSTNDQKLVNVLTINTNGKRILLTFNINMGCNLTNMSASSISFGAVTQINGSPNVSIIGSSGYHGALVSYGNNVWKSASQSFCQSIILDGLSPGSKTFSVNFSITIYDSAGNQTVSGYTNAAWWGYCSAYASEVKV